MFEQRSVIARFPLEATAEAASSGSLAIFPPRPVAASPRRQKDATTRLWRPGSMSRHTVQDLKASSPCSVGR